mmetsp:Transcript_33234/g.80691  ORF Transcript_33234/g.80691 Transcript_33234/m.80691 type:complete len:206 (+) Transcript_33234:2475-3092(+)
MQESLNEGYSLQRFSQTHEVRQDTPVALSTVFMLILRDNDVVPHEMNSLYLMFFQFAAYIPCNQKWSMFVSGLMQGYLVRLSCDGTYSSGEKPLAPLLDFFQARFFHSFCVFGLLTLFFVGNYLFDISPPPTFVYSGSTRTGSIGPSPIYFTAALLSIHFVLVGYHNDIRLWPRLWLLKRSDGLFLGLLSFALFSFFCCFLVLLG